MCQIKRSEFHVLMASIYLFSYLWDVINVLDQEDHEKRISKETYDKSMELCQSMDFLHISKITNEQWRDEFKRLDKTESGFISFNDLCMYITTNIINMDNFMTEDDHLRLYRDSNPSKRDDEEEEEEEPPFEYISAAAAVAAWEAEQALKKSKVALDTLQTTLIDQTKSEEIETIIKHAIETAEDAKEKYCFIITFKIYYLNLKLRASHGMTSKEAWDAESRANKAMLEMEFALSNMNEATTVV